MCPSGVTCLVLFLLSAQFAMPCFLNSCPYRRYGRTLQCASCGPMYQGVCVNEGRCCTHEACYVSTECTFSSVCPELFCKIDRNPGYCVKDGICCTSGGCQPSEMC
ncbi:unnamed protein product [Caenorhabditis bovis]|uniref:Uncharacterized protein n=1 Tax=Caenorhabditis bovis TaxID=2654633 RepID=A0A8S1FDW6_9PELO|nr:unnamed protein product [Caenorhabditis bovis]